MSKQTLLYFQCVLNLIANHHFRPQTFRPGWGNLTNLEEREFPPSLPKPNRARLNMNRWEIGSFFLLHYANTIQGLIVFAISAELSPTAILSDFHRLGQRKNFSLFSELLDLCDSTWEIRLLFVSFLRQDKKFAVGVFSSFSIIVREMKNPLEKIECLYYHLAT